MNLFKKNEEKWCTLSEAPHLGIVLRLQSCGGFLVVLAWAFLMAMFQSPGHG